MRLESSRPVGKPKLAMSDRFASGLVGIGIDKNAMSLFFHRKYT